MSGLASGITKVFQTVGSGIARVGSAMKGVATSVFTAGAATGSSLGSLAGGLGSGGVLSSMLSGAAKVASMGPAGLVGGLALAGPAAATAAATPSLLEGSGFSSLLGGAGTDTLGSVASGASDALAGEVGSTVADTAAGGGGGFLDFLGNDKVMGALGGLGEGLMKQEELDQQSEDRQKDRDYLRAKEQRLQDSYNIGAGALPNGASTGVIHDVARPTPSQRYARKNYRYDPQTMQMVTENF